MSEERAADASNADIDRQFAAIVHRLEQETTADAEPEDVPDHLQGAATAINGKPMWYLVPLRMICTITFFMALSSCIAAYGCVMNEARWGTATLISLCVSVGSAVCRHAAKTRYDQRNE
ncbi:hypothetical protein ABII15_00515 [Streptomyces sp. HUAS MG91]|uniref:DUF3040 domain-containing protein n=1 Tax=Streptomyces tabacisoli TaxID=3156398 RepID=A0AAU8IKA2_9ACTN